MCGIYGIAKSPTPYTQSQYDTTRKVLREVATLSETRGAHSSGIAQVGADTRLHKSLLPSSKFIDTKEYSRAVKSLKSNDNNILLGHTRFATEGAIIKSNAHPFKVGDVIGAHNGCVYNIAEMQATLDKQCPVDSQLIFKAINDNDNISNAFKDFDSDFALSFVKKNPNILYLCRESNRPLYVAYVKSLKTLFYASDDDFLQAAFDKYNVAETEIVSLNKNVLYAYDVTKFTDVNTNVTKTDFEYESRVYNSSINNYYDRFYSHYGKGNYAFDYYDDESFDNIDHNDIIEEERQSLSEYYGGSPQDWYYDEADDEWYFYDCDSEQMYSESQILGQRMSGVRDGQMTLKGVYDEQ